MREKERQKGFLQGAVAALDVVALYDQGQCFKDIVMGGGKEPILAEIMANGLDRTKEMAKQEFHKELITEEKEFYKDLGKSIRKGMKINGWITSATVSRKFHIQGNDLRKLRKELKSTHHMKKGNGGLWLFSLDYLKSKYELKEVIPEKLITWE